MGNFDFQNKTVVLMIKVAMLGGAERQALGLANYLIKKYRCKVHLVATHSNEATEEFSLFAKDCGITKIDYFGTPSLTIRKEFSFNNLKKTVRAIRYLHHMKKEISKYNPDILIPFLNTPSKISSLLYKQVGAKVTFWHQLGLDNYSFDWLEKKAINNVPFIISNAENGLDIFRKNYNVKESKLFVLPQYVSIDRKYFDKRLLKNKFSIPEDSFCIGMIAHYRTEKHQELLIKAFVKINSTKKIHLVFLGNKNNSQETLDKYSNLEKLRTKLMLNDKVSLLYEQPVEEVLNCLDIGVLVSEIEGTPNVVMEYMLYGLPVIATHHDGCIGLLKESEFLISNDEQVLVNKISLLLNNEIIREQESKLNTEKIKEYNIDNYISRLTFILNSK